LHATPYGSVNSIRRSSVSPLQRRGCSRSSRGSRLVRVGVACSGCTNSTAGCSPRRVSTDRRSMRTCSRRPARQRTALPMRRSGGWN
jgi:hypothetical protein